MTMVSGNALLAQSLFQMLLARATWQDATATAADPRDATHSCAP